MATFAVTKNETVCNVPFLLRKLTCTGGATSVAYTHGESRSPDMIVSQVTTETPTVTTVAVVRTSATVVTLDTLGDAADGIDVYLIWFNQASGGQSTITTV
jgi:hypothetical protein